MCAQMTFPGFAGSTSLQGSGDGPRPSHSPTGRTTSPPGPDHPPASLSASPGKDSAETTPGTSPPTLRGWSGLGAPRCCSANRSPAQRFSARFQDRLAERLQARLHGRGAMIYRIGWKRRVTPMGRQICALRASAPRTSDSVSFLALFAGTLCRGSLSGWPTTTATDGVKQGAVSPRPGMMGLSETAPLAGWPTSRAADGAKNVRSAEGTAREIERKGGPQDLQMASTLAGWSTPSARDWKDSPGMALEAVNPDGSARSRIDQLPRQAQLASGTTGPARFTASGAMLTGCSAGMNGGGPLNPEHSRWLMGYRAAWGYCGDMAMRSIRTSRQRSSKPSPDQSST